LQRIGGQIDTGGGDDDDDDDDDDDNVSCDMLSDTPFSKRTHADRRPQCEVIVTRCLSGPRGAAEKEMHAAAVATNERSGGCHLEKGHVSFWCFRRYRKRGE